MSLWGFDFAMLKYFFTLSLLSGSYSKFVKRPDRIKDIYILFFIILKNTG